MTAKKGGGPDRQDRPAAVETSQPSPEELELMGLGVIVAVMRQMTAAERWEVVEEIGRRAPSGRSDPAPYLEADAHDLGLAILGAWRKGAELGSLTLARMILDAGYRKVAE